MFQPSYASEEANTSIESIGDQQSLQHEVKIAVKNVEAYLNFQYLPALTNLRRAIFRPETIPFNRVDAALNFISVWMELDDLVRANLGEQYEKELSAIEEFICTVSNFELLDNYRILYACGRRYSKILQECGVNKMTEEDATV